MLQEDPRSKAQEDLQFDEWIQDGRVLCRVINKYFFNAVPADIVNVSNNDVTVSFLTDMLYFKNCVKEFSTYNEKYCFDKYEFAIK